MVSVVIPMYNAENVIADQLGALAKQRYDGDWEVIVADNCSTDRGAHIVESFADQLPGLRLVPATEHQGASYARNVGTRAAKGDVVLYADADDRVAPGWIAALASALREADFVGGWRRPGGPDAGAATDTNHRTAPSKLPHSFDFLPWAYGSNCGVRRHVFDQVSGWNETYTHGGDDVDFSWRIQLAGFSIKYAPDAVVYYRERPSLRGAAKQRFEFGCQAPLLLREFRRHGAKAPPLGRVLMNGAWIISRIPYLFLTNSLRRKWVGVMAGTVGRCYGSVKWKTWCL